MAFLTPTLLQKQALSRLTTVLSAMLLALAGTLAPLSAPAQAAVTFPAVQQARLSPVTGPTFHANFGQSVAISGDTLVIGSRSTDTNTGNAHIYVRSGSTWSEQAVVYPDDTDPADAVAAFAFSSVAISGDTAVIPESGALSGNTSVYVFARSGTNWIKQARIPLPADANGDEFGTQAAINGDTLVVSAPPRFGSGAAYVYSRSGTIWTQQARLTSSGQPGENFGVRVALSGDTVFVGTSSQPYSVYVFQRTGSSWAQQGIISNPGDGRFGNSIALSGDTAVIGSWDENASQGMAYVYTRTGTTWSLQAPLVPDEQSAYNLYGCGVALDGDVAAVGSANHNSFAGDIRIFTRTGTAWTQQTRMVVGDPYWLTSDYPDYLGCTVAMNGGTLVAGVSQKDAYTGAAYVFTPGTPPAHPRSYLGVYRPSTGVFYLRYSNRPDQPDTDLAIVYGDANYLPVIGDWDGDGIDTIGVYSKVTGFFHLRDTNSTGIPNHLALFGNPGDTPLAGHWDNTMTADGIGVYRPSSAMAFLRRSATSGAADYVVLFGTPSDQPIAGDWDGDGLDTLGVLHTGPAPFFQLTDSNASPTMYYRFMLAVNGGIPFAGDFGALGHSGVGVFTPGGVLFTADSAVASNFYFNTYFDASIYPDNAVIYGNPGDIPVAGHWVAGSRPSPLLRAANPLQGLLIQPGYAGVPRTAPTPVYGTDGHPGMD